MRVCTLVHLFFGSDPFHLIAPLVDRRRHSKKSEVLALPGSRIALLSDVIQEQKAPDSPEYHI